MSNGRPRDDFNLQEAFILARETLKALFFVNGGGAVALLSFYGNLLAKDHFNLAQDSANSFARSLFSFAFGLFLAVLATSLGYLTQLAWGSSADDEQHVAAHLRLARWFQVLAILIAFLSGLCFLVGIIVAAWGLQAARSVPVQTAEVFQIDGPETDFAASSAFASAYSSISLAT